MKVFNSSGTRFAHHELLIGPGVTSVPETRVESVRALIKKYPEKLSELTAEGPGHKVTADVIAAKDAELAKLRGQVTKLQELLTKDPSQLEPKAVANKRANQAEADLADAREEIGTLRAELAALKERPAGG